MDIFSHTLWAAFVAKSANRRQKKLISVPAMAWWGVFPDIFSFTIMTTFLVWQRFWYGHDGLRPDTNRALRHANRSVEAITKRLYTISHSLVVFSSIFGTVWLKRILAHRLNPQKSRQPPLAMSGWLMHILMDIPTHTAAEYPTPFLWPVSKRVINGRSWETKRFLLTDAGLLMLAYGLLYWRHRKSTRYDVTLSSSKGAGFRMVRQAHHDI